ncbi:DUF1040 family protein [Aliikangiella sp. G2MR2-5]|uniref:DUF1040 family protein n=1 Tax=Aliikangiella sp. G2MR2-5 TaxID=2788943 RepID=UPI0018AB821F|nr:DUF1040 family protein [Aliikangiella sp. G2MR2-5]
MRDPARIDEILILINRIWTEEPDIRFMQLIYNLQREFSSLNNGLGKVEEKVDDSYSIVGFDLFNLEDDKFLEFLENKVKYEV